MRFVSLHQSRLQMRLWCKRGGLGSSGTENPFKDGLVVLGRVAIALRGAYKIRKSLQRLVA